MTVKTALLLVNPNSRRGRDSLPDVRRLLDEAGLRFIEPQSEFEGTTSEAIEKHLGSVDLVIVGGGDGSLNGAAEGLLKTGLPLGVLPLGTANDFARTVGLPLNLAAAIKAIAKDKTTQIDLGEANGHLFFNVASVGFSADLALSLTEKAKKRWGKLGYAIVAARLLASSRLFTATLEHDGQTEELRTLQVAVGNGRFYGGGMTVHADATATDGMLDFYSLEVDHWWRLLKLLPSIRKGTHGNWNDVRSFSTKDLTIRTSKPRAVNLDGELKTNTPVKFSIREKAISVFVP
ncbi:MAG: lipid kinase [Hoeflea sp.]|uniref:lipid kinase n=1 Tax=Hoeflea sp. TaxID=1940281 RepID=UPI001DF00C0E|nr:lipid kinase [Hoeflea sp.]MBU4532016.1 lipid kinase [Alphaproteobacteria bacterium]MBU4543261.1 lipid kinase [Alphaproteobacteria bacterium]MBU4549831.1 lipid kinase [Alphaproteobacteria bacterium]MBV1726392.1 lipid kinase [Hoeflea sp.]MBV1786247.1 lipid kinase [Hoeflea sp.]